MGVSWYLPASAERRRETLVGAMTAAPESVWGAGGGFQTFPSVNGLAMPSQQNPRGCCNFFFFFWQLANHWTAHYRHLLAKSGGYFWHFCFLGTFCSLNKTHKIRLFFKSPYYTLYTREAKENFLISFSLLSKHCLLLSNSQTNETCVIRTCHKGLKVNVLYGKKHTLLPFLYAELFKLSLLIWIVFLFHWNFYKTF